MKGMLVAIVLVLTVAVSVPAQGQPTPPPSTAPEAERLRQIIERVAEEIRTTVTGLAKSATKTQEEVEKEVGVLKQIETTALDIKATLMRMEASTRVAPVAETVAEKLGPKSDLITKLGNIESNTTAQWNALFVGLLIVVIVFLGLSVWQRVQDVRLVNAAQDIHRYVERTTATPSQPRIDAVALAQANGEARGPVTGGTRIRIAGRNFQPRARVTLRGREANDVRWESARLLEAATPAMGPDAVGLADVTVVNPDGGLDTSENAFTYRRAAPEITAIHPELLPLNGGEIYIFGANFAPNVQIEIEGQAMQDSTWRSANGVRVRVLQHAAGPVQVAVVNLNDGQRAERRYNYG